MAVAVLNSFRFVFTYNLFYGSSKYAITYDNAPIALVSGPYTYFHSIPTLKEFKSLDDDMVILSFPIYGSNSAEYFGADIYLMTNELAQAMTTMSKTDASRVKTQFLTLIEEKKYDEVRHYVNDEMDLSIKKNEPTNQP